MPIKSLCQVRVEAGPLGVILVIHRAFYPTFGECDAGACVTRLTACQYLIQAMSIPDSNTYQHDQ